MSKSDAHFNESERRGIGVGTKDIYVSERCEHL